MRKDARDGIVRSPLQESNIHGFKYLVLTKHPVPRCIWFVAIQSALVAACIIVHLNIRNFRNSPTVVTSVEEFDIKVEKRRLAWTCQGVTLTSVSQNKIQLPMVTVCPMRADWSNIIEFLFETDGLSREETDLLTSIHFESVVYHIKRKRLRLAGLSSVTCIPLSTE